MAITPIGFILIPLSLVIFVLWPKYLVPWAILVSVFSAASIVNFSGTFLIGIAPFWFVAILIALRFTILYLGGRFSFGRGDLLLSLLRPLLIFTAWGILSAFMLPFLFSNVEVDAARATIQAATPLHWTMSNAAQAIYLLLDCLFILYVSRASADPDQLELSMNAFRWAGVIAVAVGGYEFLAHQTGLPFPTEFFHSNESMSQLVAEKLAGTWRLSSTASEPSGAGGFFAGWSTFLLLNLSNPSTARRSDWLLLSSGVVMLILTTSSTGYVAAAVLLAILAGQLVMRLFVRGFVDPRLLLVCAMLVAVGIVTMTRFPDFHQLLAQVLWQKSESLSGKARIPMIWRAFEITGESWGLGVGLGSNRTSGMLFYVISNLGVPGLILFAYVVYVTSTLAREACDPSLLGPRLTNQVRTSLWVFAVWLLAMTISGSEVSSFGLWVVWSLVVAGISHSQALMRAVASQAATAQPRQLLTERPSTIVLRPTSSVVLLAPDLPVTILRKVTED